MTATAELVGLLDFAWTRLLQRVEGLADEEYLWEPVPRCWTLRTGADGRLRADRGFPPPDPAPVTTIAWLVTHLTERRPATGTLWPLVVGDSSGTAPTPPPATAAEAVERLAATHDGWRDAVGSIPDELLDTRLGDLGALTHDYGGGAYAESTVLALVLHAIDEHVHHGAQIATLRDLYRHSPDKRGHHSPAHHDPLVDAILRGDGEHAQPDPADHTDAVARAVAIGGPPAVRRLLELGFPIDQPGQVPTLHLAVSYGDAEMVGLLVELGADLDATDPFFDATPLVWAKYFAHGDLVPLLMR